MLDSPGCLLAAIVLLAGCGPSDPVAVGENSRTRSEHLQRDGKDEVVELLEEIRRELILTREVLASEFQRLAETGPVSSEPTTDFRALTDQQWSAMKDHSEALAVAEQIPFYRQFLSEEKRRLDKVLESESPTDPMNDEVRAAKELARSLLDEAAWPLERVRTLGELHAWILEFNIHYRYRPGM